MKHFVILAILSMTFLCCKDIKEDKSENFFLPPAATYNYAEIDSVKLFYRAAGDKNKPVIVLLHGYPSSSHSYRNLIPMLSTHYYVMYMQDFGAPVGYRMMMEDPKRIDALIVQNANAYLDGLTPKRQEFFRTAQTDSSQVKYDFLYSLTGEDAVINKQYLFDLDTTNVNIQSPDAWTHDLAFLSSKKDRQIQVQLFQDYNNNLLSYPKWQNMLKENQPKTLITWGKKDLKFNANGAKAYLRDLQNAELHLLDAGHFAAEEKTREIAELILKFLDKHNIK